MVADEHDIPKRPKDKESLLDIYNNTGLKTIPAFQVVNPGGTFELWCISIERYLNQFIKEGVGGKNER